MSLRTLVNDKPVWDAFIEELDQRIAIQHKSMESLGDRDEIYRHQGAIRALRLLKYLRDEVNGSN
tara:strand:+ start:7073 stop:7267 length:195 start_codon:yes stop_codon:yes gene_type:complete